MVNEQQFTMADAPKILKEMEDIKKQAMLDYLKDRKKHYQWFYNQQKSTMENGIQ